MSLPTRERGLKQRSNAGFTIQDGSLPTRERGLKQEGHDKLTIGSWSLPTRERGLKPAPNSAIATAPCVAPYAGAWIETIINKIAPNLTGSRSLRGSVD